MKTNLDFIQVITHLPDGKVRVYKVTDAHIGDDNDPLTTIYVDGYEDLETKKGM